MDYRKVLEEQITKIQEMQNGLKSHTLAGVDVLLRSAEEIRILAETAKNMPRQSN